MGIKNVEILGHIPVRSRDHDQTLSHTPIIPNARLRLEFDEDVDPRELDALLQKMWHQVLGKVRETMW